MIGLFRPGKGAPNRWESATFDAQLSNRCQSLKGNRAKLYVTSPGILAGLMLAELSELAVKSLIS